MKKLFSSFLTVVMVAAILIGAWRIVTPLNAAEVIPLPCPIPDYTCMHDGDPCSLLGMCTCKSYGTPITSCWLI